MKHDDVLAGIRDHVRAERADDAALEAVARGEGESPAVLELERRAATDAEAAAMLEASRPLGDEVEEKIAAKIHAKRAAGSKDAGAKASADGGRVLPFLRRAAVVAGPLSLAAVVLFYVATGGQKEKGNALLPEFSVVASGEKEMRGTDDAPGLRLRGGPDASFEIVARPATNAGHVVAYVFAIGEGEPNPVQANVEVAPEGSVRIRGRARALEGAREVRVVLGTANDSITRYEDAMARARDGKSDTHVRVLVIPIVR